MKTIAIIGGGIAGRSILFAMAKKSLPHKILLFQSPEFAFPCSVHSTAIVAPRGVSSGHSELGDHLVSGFQRFSRHVSEDSPAGVLRIPQYTGAETKLEAFKKRYPDGFSKSSCGRIPLNKEMYISEESAFMIRPREYMDWLLDEAKKKLHVTEIPAFVTEVKETTIRTVDQVDYSADEIIFTTGVHNDLWHSLFPALKTAKSVQGCYLEFSGINLGEDSFSLTLEGKNLIYDAGKSTLLAGSTTHESRLELPPERELMKILADLQMLLGVKLPEFREGKIRTGLREKGPKREPYLIQVRNYSMVGGFYKNGYSLGLSFAEKLLSSQQAK